MFDISLSDSSWSFLLISICIISLSIAVLFVSLYLEHISYRQHRVGYGDFFSVQYINNFGLICVVRLLHLMKEIDAFIGLINDPMWLEFGQLFYLLLFVPMILFPCLPFSYLLLDYLNILIFLFSLSIDFIFCLIVLFFFRGHSRD